MELSELEILMAKCGNEHCNHTEKAHTYLSHGNTTHSPSAYTGCHCKVYIKKT